MLILIIDHQPEAELVRDLNRSYRRQKIKAKNNSVFFTYSFKSTFINLFLKLIYFFNSDYLNCIYVMIIQNEGV